MYGSRTLSVIYTSPFQAKLRSLCVLRLVQGLESSIIINNSIYLHIERSTDLFFVGGQVGVLGAVKLLMDKYTFSFPNVNS